MAVQDLFQAYYDARRHKRGSISALAFEMDYETNLFTLYDDIMNERYEIGRSTCFISFKPVQREIFAADFRDRVVHHFIYNYISPGFERIFINDSYSCRVGRGTSYGIKRVDHFMRSCSLNYSRDSYVLKLDIKGYFMAIDKSLLYDKVEEVVHRYREKITFDTGLLLRLISQIISHDPTKNYRISGGWVDWVGLPRSKSLFWAGPNKGLPIGNLTSQLFGNVYFNDFDHFVKHELGCAYYGRYVDDFIIVHQDKKYLKTLIPLLKNYLWDTLALELHPKKIYLQHISKGVPFLGVIIKPYRLYIGNKTKTGFYQSIGYWNKILARTAGNLKKEDVRKFSDSVNSYLGAMKHYDTYKLRRTMLAEHLAPKWGRYVKISPEYDKIIVL